MPWTETRTPFLIKRGGVFVFLVLERLMQLVINTPGTFITQKDECFRLKQKEKKFDISPLKVESVLISN